MSKSADFMSIEVDISTNTNSSTVEYITCPACGHFFSIMGSTPTVYCPACGRQI